MDSSSQSAAFSGGQALASFRDAQGFLPLADCEKCGTRLIGRVSQKPSSKGRRFYKCPRLEHTDMACRFYMFEESYVEFLVNKGMLPPSCQLRGTRGDLCRDAPANLDLKDAIQGCTEQMREAMKGVERSIRDVKDAQSLSAQRICRLVEIGVYVGFANLFVLVLLLLVLLVK